MSEKGGEKRGESKKGGEREREKIRAIKRQRICHSDTHLTDLGCGLLSIWKSHGGGSEVPSEAGTYAEQKVTGQRSGRRRGVLRVCWMQ